MFLHTLIVNQTAFIFSQPNRRDEVTIYSHRNGTCLRRQTKNDAGPKIVCFSTQNVQ